MGYLSLYRKWRPQSFVDIAGQKNVVETLKNAIRLDRIAHAYLFCGPRGTGKTSTAKILAKSLNCSEGPTIDPCGECEVCQKIQNNSSIDVIEIDAASNRGIDEIRELREKVKFFPTEGNYKVYIIDEAHMLTKEAFNALLKTLEEPPEYVIFILATTEPHALLPTILSRCQRFDFSRLSVNDIIDRLNFICEQEDVKLTSEAGVAIARSAEGGMRDAISILDQVISYSGNQVGLDDVAAVLGLVEEAVLFEMVNIIVKQKVDEGIKLVNKVINQGKDILQFVSSLINHFRNLLIQKECEITEGLIELPNEQIKKLEEQAADLTTEELLRLINILVELETELKRSNQPRILLEMGIIKLTKPEIDTSLAGVLDRLTTLEEKIKGKNYLPAKDERQISNEEVKEVTEKIQDIEQINDQSVPDEKLVSKKEERAEDKNVQTDDGDSSAEVNESGLSFAEIKDKWSDILEYIRQKEIRTHAMLTEGRLSAINGNNLIIEFDNNRRFHKENVDRKREVIEGVIRKNLGKKLKVKTVFAENNNYKVKENSKQEEKKRKNEVKDSKESNLDKVKDERIIEDPLVKDVLEIFDGEVLKVKKD